MKKELHYGPRDFIVEWFSGSGAGGQHRNKHQNCCRIRHKQTGLTAVSQESRSRVDNQRIAFERLAARILAYYYADNDLPRFKSEQVIRNYHGVRNEVHDKASELKMSYTEVVKKANLGPMIEARLEAKATQ